MKTTTLFALIVALLARGPAGHGPGQEAPGTPRPSEQPSSAAGPPPPPRPEVPVAKDAASQTPVKDSQSARKD